VKWWKFVAPVFSRGESPVLEKRACGKCESCFPCKYREKNEANNARIQNEFDRNVTALNRIAFTCMFMSILVSNAGLWLYLSW
jgi:hypothetical protein